VPICELDHSNAFELLASLDAAPAVIFTTAFDAHAVRAFEVSALDYLLKPVAPERLAAAIDRALSTYKPSLTTDRVFVRDGERCWFVRLADVGVIESEGNYARLDIPGQPLLSRSLSYLEARLAPDFFRASRKHLVNLKLVDKVEPGPSGGLVLIMPNGREVEMSRRAAQRFRAIMSV
jgi:two-component system LytT family response regulator